MTKKVPIALYLADPILCDAMPPALLQTVDSLWIELSATEECEAIEKIRARGGCDVVPVMSPASGELLPPCVKETAAYRTADATGVLAEIPQRRRKKLAVCIIDDGFGRIDCGDEDAFTRRLDTLSNTVRELRNGGFQRLTVNLYHPDPLMHFKGNSYLFSELGVRPIVSLVPNPSREEGIIVEASLSLAPILYEGIADGLLVMPTEKQFREPDTLKGAIRAGKQILAALELIPKSHTLISCPVCGRCLLNLTDMARVIKGELERLVEELGPNKMLLEEAGGITVAVMGCNVNGPGEARDADIGVAGGKNRTGTIFKFGTPVKTVDEGEIVREMVKGMREVIEKKIGTLGR